MPEKEVEQIDKPLTGREKMVIHLLLFLIKVLKPFNWSHELDKALSDFDKELKKG